MTPRERRPDRNPACVCRFESRICLAPLLKRGIVQLPQALKLPPRISACRGVQLGLETKGATHV